ncbi:sensor histidine kinase [Rugosimonospora africana]|uniref:sensor histidine kinase n=1 Tax=Rugosimonospora africana TaxID=556532 RepID=UPI001EF16B82|nr:HAMP domain-containing sensor histidine kinase [Rugosimonospora africana]
MRIRLVVAVVALVGCALAIVGVATVTAVRRYLTDRVDAQLQILGNSFERQMAVGNHGLSFSPLEVAPNKMNVPTPYLLESLLPDGSLYDSYPQPLPASMPLLRNADLRRTGPFTVSSTAPGGPHWRVLVVTGPQGQQVVVASNLTDPDRVAGELLLLTVLVEVGALAAVTVLGIWLVRLSLRPLREIEAATVSISTGDMSQRVPDWDPRTEVGRLGRSFNTMIERIQQAFAAQAASEAAAHVSEARARRSEDKMRQFVADASHELRTPLTTIRGFAELYRQASGASRDPVPPQRTASHRTAPHRTASQSTASHSTVEPQRAAELMRRIEDEAARMGLLVEDLLLLARLDEQRPLATEPVDLIVLVNDALEATRAMAPARSIAMELSTGGPLMVNGDESRLRQVLTNLIGNALKYTPDDASLTVRLLRRPEYAAIEVADTGPGLAPEQAQRVFERFYRVDPSRNRHDGPPGTGLGLAIVAAIVAAHAGMVEVDSTPGEGATFRVLLPLPAGSAPLD